MTMEKVRVVRYGQGRRADKAEESGALRPGRRHRDPRVYTWRVATRAGTCAAHLEGCES